MSVWATVTDASPLRIRVDGDSAELPFTPDTLIDPSLLAVNDRVRCELSSGRVVVHGLAGGVPVYTQSEVDALIYTRTALDGGQLDTRYYTEAEIAALFVDAFTWKPVVPTTIGSSGATATLNSTTGLITCPAGVTALTMNGIHAVGYETLIVAELVHSSGATGFRYRGTISGAPYSGSLYYSQGPRHHTGGVPNVNENGQPQGMLGVISTGDPGHLEAVVKHSMDARSTFVWSHSSTDTSRYEDWPHSEIDTTSLYDGTQIFADSGSFLGGVRNFRRKAFI